MRRLSILLVAATALVNPLTIALADEPPAPRPLSPAAPPADLGQQRELLNQKLAELDRLQAEVDALRAATHTPSMIVVHVEILDVSLTKMRRLGMDFANFTSDGVTPASFVEVAGGGDMAAFLDALKQNNVAKTLAAPTLATISGQPAAIHVGEQFPIPAPAGSAEPATFKKWGTELDVLAEALGNNKVRLDIRAHVSTASDDAHAIEIDGHKLPSLASKQCNTTCEMSFGETVVLGGLVSRRLEAQLRDGQFIEQPNEVALLMVVHVEDADRLTSEASPPVRVDRSVTKTIERRPAPHDAFRR